MPSQQILQKKLNEVEEIVQLVNRYRVIGVASLHKVRATQLQELKKKIADKAYVKVIKNTLMMKALQKCREKPNLEKLLDHLEGANIYLFTDLNPFKLALILERGKVRTTAKAGDIAAFDVIVPAGNTGQPPGPIISQLNAVGLPTRIEAGSIWISKDTLVVRRGEVISERLASVLSKLGIKPVEAGLTMKTVYDEGLIITQDELRINVNETKQAIEKARLDAFVLSLCIAYPTQENVALLLKIAHQEAYALSLNAAIPTRETIVDLIRKAYFEMMNLNSKLPAR